MQITETLALADLTAVISITIAAIVAITGYRNTKHSARQTFDNFTLRFIETENADPHLYNARQWLGQAAMQSDTDLADYADIAAYFKKHGLSGNLSIRSRADGGIESYTVSQNPAAQNLLTATCKAVTASQPSSKRATPPQKPCCTDSSKKTPTALSAAAPSCTTTPASKTLSVPNKNTTQDTPRRFANWYVSGERIPRGE